MTEDPSENIHGDLLPHIHLVSTYRYPSMPRLELQEVHKWLLNVSKIARDTAPFFWTYLETPQDGSIYLTWQPVKRRGTECATDGYVWASAETYFRQEVGNGLVLEIFFQRCGYRMGEPAAVHSRRRFRLMPLQSAMPNTPPVDPNLWIVHYGPAEKNDRIPVQMIPVTPQMQQTLAFRQQLLSMGQIVRKEFMLSDRINWPHISLPGRGNSMYAPPVNVRGVPQAMAYPPQGVAPGPTPKRRGGQAAPQAQGHPQAMVGAVPSLEAAYDDEEDTSRGDMFDHLTPREVSITRYQQNHEWMEEILSSPYRIQQIVVPDLGLGRKGELASLTEGIFEAQGSEALAHAPKKPYVGHLDPGLADEFRKRANEKIESTNAEIEKIKADYEKVLAKMKTNEAIADAEIDLRAAVQETGQEFWRLEGRLEETEEGTIKSPPKTDKKEEDILALVEGLVGKKSVTVPDVHQVQEGGYQPPLPEPEPEPVPQEPQAVPGAADAEASASMSRLPSQNESQNSGIMIGDSDIDMGGTAAGLLDQMHTGFSSTPTPVNNFPTPQPHLSAMGSSVATPAGLNAPSPQPTQPTPAAGIPAPSTAATGDVTMQDSNAPKADAPTVPDQGTESGDWVVVSKNDSSQGGPSPSAAGAAAVGTSAGTPQAQPAPAAAAPTATAEEPVKTQEPQVASKPVSAAPTPADGEGFDGDHNDFSSLGDLDTAGDALASYDGTGGDLGDGLDLNMDMDDSAFGDAFHGVEQSAGDTPADSGM